MFLAGFCIGIMATVFVMVLWAILSVQDEEEYFNDYPEDDDETF